MKKIINGRMYDTDTARYVWGHVHQSDPGEDPDDIYCFEEDLDCKRNTESFLHGIGGSGTPYARSVGNNNWAGGEKIVPLTYEEAKEWASKNMLDPSEYMREFGPVPEDSQRITIAISIPGHTAEKAKRLAAANGTTVSALIARMIENADT